MTGDCSCILAVQIALHEWSPVRHSVSELKGQFQVE
jgi:hypothetical protein